MAALNKLDVLAAEATADPDGTDVELGDAVLRVLPMEDWRSSAVHALKTGDFDAWAGLCLTEDSFQLWLDADPTLREIDRFFTAWGQATGQAVGESSASPRRLRSTARRSKPTSRSAG